MSADYAAQQTANRLQTIAKIIRSGIEDDGMDIIEAARKWPLSRATLTRMLRGEKVSTKFYAIVALELGLPPRLFRMILDGDTDGILELDNLDPYVRRIVTASPGGAAATGT